ncbi:MAG: hypothetical protein KDA51_11095, partial [Planctomycetales bacterium]|nr:hypothetical protein [Planctomycetales bacterium]
MAGRVLGPDGNPVADARVIVLYDFQANTTWQHSFEPAGEMLTDNDGRYAITVDKISDRFSDGRNIEKQTLCVLASKPGLGPDQVDVSEGSPEDTNLELAATTSTLRGQIVDLEGRGVPGVQIRLVELKTAAKPLEEWLEKAKDNPASVSEEMRVESGGLPVAYFPKENVVRAVDALRLPVLTTDAQGRFELPGLGDDREVILRI